MAATLGASLAACGSSTSAPSATFTALPYAVAISPDGRTIGGGSFVSQSETGPVPWVNGTVHVLPFMDPRSLDSLSLPMSGHVRVVEEAAP